jgi:hypothetical protein
MAWRLSQNHLRVLPVNPEGARYLYLGGSWLLEVRGDPSGGDFSHYWVASSLALTAGRPRFTILNVSWRPRKSSFIKARGKANASQGLR